MSVPEPSDISARLRESLAAIDRRTLELIVRGASLRDVLGALCDGIDALDPELVSVTATPSRSTRRGSQDKQLAPVEKMTDLIAAAARAPRAENAHMGLIDGGRAGQMGLVGTRATNDELVSAARAEIGGLRTESAGLE